MNRAIRLIFFVQLLIFSGLNSYSQTLEEIRKQADIYFEQGKFIEATPLYSKLLSNAPKDPDLNFRYGTCLLYNSRNKSDAIRHLSFAVKDPTIDKRAFFYLGRAYHLNYQFNEAIIQYQKFKSVASPTQLKDFQVDQQIQACKNGKQLLSDITDMIVIKKTEIKKEDFYQLYNLQYIGGTILVTDEFGTKLDKSKGHRAVIHFPSNSPAIFYSSYGEDGDTGLDIWVRRRLPDGKYGQPQKVTGGVNTGFDEDYPYMHPSGDYLYFCSKGHNSMGGYDVFRCKYDERNNTFGPAENMDFAISSPDDDLLFIVDSLNQTAYFSSARESQDGKIFVYQVRVERIPLQIAVIKGNFVNSIFAANKVVSIEVQNFSTGETIGTFNSKESNGDYLISFPKPGKYIYLVTVKGSDVTHKAIVDIPFTSEFKPLKQRITVARDDSGEEYVKIENLFNEEFDDPIAVMAEIYRELSALIPNSAKFDIDSLNKANENNNVFVEAGLDPYLTKEDIEKVVDDEIKDLQNAISEDEKNASIAYNLAEAKSDSANAQMVEINQLVEQAENATDPDEKTRILKDVDEKTSQVERLNEESKDLVVLGNEIDKSIEIKETTLIQANETKTDLTNTPPGDKTALGNVIEENKTFFVENVKDNSPYENVVDEIISSNAQQANSTQKLNGEIATLRKEQNDLEKKNEALEQQLEATKNKKEKEAIEQQILDNTTTIEGLKIQIIEKEKAYDQAIQSGDNSQLGNAAVIVENPKNNTADNTKQLSDSEKNAITSKVEDNNLDENIAQVNQVLKENNIGGPQLNLFGSDETTKKYNLQQWNDAIDSEIDRLNTEKMKASPEDRVKIDQEIQRYVELKEQKKTEFEYLDNPEQIQPTINKEDIVSDYTSRKDEINKITDDEKRHQENLNLNEQLRDELIKEKNSLQKVLDENPGNKNVQERIANVDKLLGDVNAEIVTDQNWIKQNTGAVVVDTDKIVAEVDPGYQSRVNEIYKISDPAERDEQMKILNESFTDKSNERVQELEAYVKSNPADAISKAELAELQRLNQQVAADASQPLVKPIVLDVATLSSKVTPDQLIDEYTQRKTDIAKITDPFERKKAENDLNTELSNEIRNEITELETLLAENPGNTTISDRIENLKKLDDQLNTTIVSNENWMKENPQPDKEIIQESDVKIVNPDYQAEVDKIDQIQNTEEKKEAIENLNTATVDKIEDRIETLDQMLAKDPNDQSALNEKKELTELKTQIQNNPDQTLTQPTDITSINTKPSISEIMPDYQDKMNSINGSSESTIEKEKDKIALNENLISLIDGEINTLTNAKTTNPGAAKDIDKRISGLNAIKTNTLAEIQTSKTKIGDDSSTTSVSSQITANTILPGYDKKISDIQKNSLDEKTKLTEENGLNNQLISAIDKKIKDLENEKLANPANAAAIDKDIQTLQNIKTQKQNEINLNNDRINEIESGTTSSRPAITINSIMPEYETKMADINQKSADEKTKLLEKNALNNQLISVINSEIADLQKEKEDNPANAAAIDKDIQTLQSIKTQKQIENGKNNDRISEIESGTTSSRPSVTITSIMPDYETKMTGIDQKSADEKTKLTEKNALNNQLIAAIDSEIADLQKEKEANPENAATIDKDIQTLQNIKTQKQTEINQNNNRIKEIESGTTSSRPSVTISSIMPDYETKMAGIDQKSADEKTKLTEKNALNNQLIATVDSEIAELQKEKEANPANAAAIDKDIQTLQNIKTQKQTEINQNNNRIKEIESGTTSSRPVISINALMPSYEPGMQNIDASNESETKKLEQKNALNRELISTIDSKIASLEKELKSNPSDAAQIQQEIDKLEELKEAKTAEIDKNNQLIKSMESGDMSTRSVGDSNPDDFSSEEGKNVIESHQNDIEEIKAIDQDIEDLNTQLANTSDPKEQVKIQNQIDKKENSQARIENEILEDLAVVNQNEYAEQKTTAEVTGDIATAKNANDPAIQEANQNISKADQLMLEAQQLRNEAANEKDPKIANEKLELAYEKEQEAKNLIEEANRTFKTAEVIDGLKTTNETVVTSVSENPSDRESTQLFDQAASLEAKATDLNEQANQLRENSLTEKKKYREAMVIEAQKLDSIAAVYRDEASQIKSQANQVKAQEDAILEALPETSDQPVDQATVNDIIATNEYKDYYEAKTNGDSNLFRAEELGNDIADLEVKKQRIIKDAIVEYGTGPELDKALANNADLKETQAEIDNLTQLQEEYRDNALAAYEKANTVLENTDSQTRDNIIAISDRDLAPVEKTVTTNPADADYEAPDQLNTSIFRTTDGNPVYTSEKPIPVDQQQPSGLVYKVQVGAFRKPLPPEYFNKFAPISGQKIGDGITRYMVGYFTNFTVADDSKDQVHDLGYPDAFVVAYCNGQRISISEAKEIEAGRKECPGTNLLAVNDMNVNQTTTNQNNTNGTTTTNQNGTTTTNQNGTTTQVITANTPEEKQLTSYYTSTTDAAPANQVEIIKGLFFTVQIGVYSKPVKASLLYNITPLNSQLTENNKIRYTTGIYCSLDDANKRKNEIVGIGITDAFVTAYYNGKRITVAEANELIATNGPSILFDCSGAGNQNNGNTAGNQNTTNNTNQNTTDNTNQNTTDNTNQNTTNNTNQNTSQSTDTTGLWRVRVGFYEGEIPQDFIELLLNNQNEGIVSESDLDENVTFYTIPYTNKADAEIRKEALVDKGFVNAETEKMPSNVDELGNKIPDVVTPKEVYYKEGVYYRIVIGKYSSDIPGEYATILLQTENILETEVDADGNTYIISTKLEDFATVKERLVELNDLGIETMEIVTYYKYDPIPFEQGNKILNDQPIDSLTYYSNPEGISADPYLYDKNAVYFRIDLGKFKDNVPQEFANLLFENADENILREETFEGETYFYTENIKSYEEAKEILDRLIAKGFKDAKLVAYHKYDIISVEKARQLLAK